MDIEGEEVQGTLWDSYAKELDSHTNKSGDEDIKIILLIQFAKVSDYKDELIVTNAFFGTRLFVNADLPDVVDFRKRIVSILGYEPSVVRSVPASSQSTYAAPEDFLSTLKRMPLDEISEHNHADLYLSYATINNIEEQYPWYYNACKKCNRKVTVMDTDHPEFGKNKTNLICSGCGPNPRAVYSRFKIHVRVVDESGDASFTLMDRDVKSLINKSCAELRKGMDMKDETIPDVLNKIVGLKLLFRVKVEQFNIDKNYCVYTVSGISSDSDTIDNFKMKFHLDQDTIAAEESQQDPIIALHTVSKDAFSVTGSNLDMTSSTADSPNAKRICLGTVSDPKSVNQVRSVTKTKNLENKYDRLDI